MCYVDIPGMPALFWRETEKEWIGERGSMRELGGEEGRDTAA